MNRRFPFPILPLALRLASLSAGSADFHDPAADPDALPTVPPGFSIAFFAREPMVRQPCSLAFDAQGRICVGMGPQYRNPTPDTPGDSVVLVLDDNGDGRADRTRIFATGFNAIQSLAWRGRDLWVANAPDLTVVRDLDGDDEADQYIRVFTDLGNLEHGLHGLNWAPDGRLYMSKGNSKGLTQPGRIAPKPFRDLWGVTAPPGTPDFPPPQFFGKSDYRHAYHDPNDDWGLEGGILRCDDLGRNLEIVSRGFRNPWDIAPDSGFNWVGTDNDQTGGDRVFMSIAGGHFGWNHPWSAQWGDSKNSPAAPVSGPLFEGSGTGVVFFDSPAFPATHRGVFYINDWLSKITYLWRPSWDGALLRPAGGSWEPFVQGGKALFRPTDLEVGPDGALWILGWSRGYGAEWKDGQLANEGRIFRVAWKDTDRSPSAPNPPAQPVSSLSPAQLIQRLDGPLPVWRIDAQEELIRRGAASVSPLVEALQSGRLTPHQETWSAWTLGRMTTDEPRITSFFTQLLAAAPSRSLNLRLQSLRILAHRSRLSQGTPSFPDAAAALLRDTEPRLRLAAVEGIRSTRDKTRLPALLDLLASETDRTTYYSAWQTVRALDSLEHRRALLVDSRDAVRRAALLGLLEEHALHSAEILPLSRDPSPGVRSLATQWLEKTSAGGESRNLRGRPLDAADPAPPASPLPASASPVRILQVRSGARYLSQPGGLTAGARPYSDRDYTLKRIPQTLEGADLVQTANDDDGASGTNLVSLEALFPLQLTVGLDTRSSHIPAWIRDSFQLNPQKIQADHWTFALYSRRYPVGRIELGGNSDDGAAGGKGNYTILVEPLPLESPDTPTPLEAALKVLPGGRPERGAVLFHHRFGPGCFQCHRVEDHGNAFGPDLNGIGSRATALHIAQSILQPNAVITEGFNLQTIETADAEYSGILLEESGVTVTLGLASGRRESIAKSSIRTRKTSPTSAMPAYNAQLMPGYVADLTAYLLTRTSAPPAAAALPMAVSRLRAEPSPDRLVILDGDRPVAHYVFSDPQILRPYFAHLHAPDGSQVSRHHPPVPGTDATDHDTMHPGLWLGFGDISGEDFWRNKGSIRHDTFSAEPALRGEALAFTTENSVIRRDGTVLARLTSRIQVRSLPDAYRIDWDATFVPAVEGFTFGDQEEMGLGARVATALTEKNGGRITSSSGEQSAARTWGKAYDWCDYSGTLNGRHAGITLMNDPAAFRAAWWHNRDYGVFVANPFGREAMKQGPKSAVAVPVGQPFRLRFGALLHASQAGTAFDSAAAYRRFVSDGTSAPKPPP